MRRFVVVPAVIGLFLGLTVSVGPPAAPLAAAPPTSGLVLNYRFDADTGVSARDSSTKALHGTYVNTTAADARISSVPGRGKAIRLVGADHEYISVPEHNALDVNRYTLAALVRYTGVQNDQTLGRWEILEKADAYWMNIRTNGKVRVGGFFGGCGSGAWKYLDSNVAIPLNTWAHVASTYNGSKLTVWINGKAAGSRTVTGTTCKNNLPLAVGAKNHTGKDLLEAFWDGRLDDIRIYNRALSASEIARLLPSS